MKHRLHQRGGFTLLELLMVVIIIGILAALALPGYIRAVENARTSEVMMVLGQLKGSVQRYCAANDAVAPGNWTDLDIDDPAGDVLLNSRWTFTFPTTMDCTTRPITITQSPVATRASGPCIATTIGYDASVANPFNITWAGSCL